MAVQSARTRNSLVRGVARTTRPYSRFELTGAVKSVAFLDIVISFYYIFYIGLHLPEWRGVLDDSISVRIGLWALYLTKLTITICLAIFLFHSATMKNVHNCRIWIGITIILFTIWMTAFFAHLSTFGLPVVTIALFSIMSIYRVFTLVIVYGFIMEIHLEGGSGCAWRGLSEKEVEEFLKGDDTMLKTCDPSANHKPYNQEYEIPMDNLVIDTENPLRQGEHGLVLKGNLTLPDGTTTLVAVKKINPNSVDIAYFKDVLSELKLMTCIGNHENIVNLIGACTQNIRDRNLLMVVDFCPYGDLHQFLKTRRGFFVNLVRRGNVCRDHAVKHYCNVQAIVKSEVITTLDLFRWASEVSHGLRYLASKGIVLGNLKAMNVLLSYDKMAKISDFALLKPLDQPQWSGCPKAEDTAWRWLAVETLKEGNFSTRSDIWALGVTIWEIYSLAETPFPGLTWTQEFIHYIDKGMRMNKPAYASDDVYNLVLECWDIEPENRPSLDTICNFFEDFFRKHYVVDKMTSVNYGIGKFSKSPSRESFVDNHSQNLQIGLN